ncbi:hypothetical protein ACTWM0_24255 [Pseudomonas machongensis]
MFLLFAYLPQSQAASCPDWQSLASRNIEQWLAEPGVGRSRAEQLRAFFAHEEVLAVVGERRRLAIEGF